MMKRAIAVAALMLLAGCGQREMLKPKPGHPLPEQPATSPTQPTVADLLSRKPEAAPVRSDDVLQKSQERPDDRFNLPPPG
jgi:hypothetical protein